MLKPYVHRLPSGTEVKPVLSLSSAEIIDPCCTPVPQSSTETGGGPVSSAPLSNVDFCDEQLESESVPGCAVPNPRYAS